MTKNAPITAQLIHLAELPDRAPAATAEAALGGHNPLHDIKARLRVCVGELELRVGDLLGAKAGQVLVLDRAIDHPVDLLLEGRVVMRGELVAVEGQFGVRITEIAVPLAA